jgi:hypothetical protein
VRRHPAFQDLSRDHFVALNRSLQVVRAVDGHPRARPFEQVAFQFLDLWLHDGLREHFLEEETDLVPVLSQRGAGALSDRLRADHERLRAGFAAIQSGTLSPSQVADVARDLTAHARWEEESVFEWLQDHLTDDELGDLLRKSQAFRTANGLPVNPPR